MYQEVSAENNCLMAMGVVEQVQLSNDAETVKIQFDLNLLPDDEGVPISFSDDNIQLLEGATPESYVPPMNVADIDNEDRASVVGGSASHTRYCLEKLLHGLVNFNVTLNYIFNSQNDLITCRVEIDIYYMILFGLVNLQVTLNYIFLIFKK